MKVILPNLQIFGQAAVTVKFESLRSLPGGSLWIPGIFLCVCFFQYAISDLAKSSCCVQRNNVIDLSDLTRRSPLVPSE